MKSNYEDILALTDKEPVWYDQNGVPRFTEFHPSLSSSIYANDVFLVLITCQACGKEFVVEMHRLYDCISHPRHLHYGDPPIHGCVGDTMNCCDIRILQAWHRSIHEPWHRLPEFEVSMDDQWEYEHDSTVGDN